MIQRITAALSHINSLTLFGLIAVSLMLIFYTLEAKSPIFVLGFAVACMMGSAYGFLQGAWPFGLVEGIWTLVALRRWWIMRGAGGSAQSATTTGL